MTSKPASDSARATTLAPRSWPSRPGFPTRIRTLRLSAMVPSQLLARDDDALHLARALGGEELADRRLAGERLLALLAPRRAEDEEPRRLELRVHVGEHELDRL